MVAFLNGNGPNAMTGHGIGPGFLALVAICVYCDTRWSVGRLISTVGKMVWPVRYKVYLP